MATNEARLEALGRLAKLLCDDDAVLGELALAWSEPARYVAEHAARLSDRGIDAPIADLAFIALIDALQARKRCIEIDWKVCPREMVSAVRSLLRSFKKKGWKAPKLDDGEELADLVAVVGSSLEETGLSLCTLNHQSDSYSLVILPTSAVELAIELARIADIGRVLHWRVEEKVARPPPALELRTITTLDADVAAPPRQFFALPRRRVVTFDGKALFLASPEGAGRIPLDRDLLPDFDPAASSPQHVLVRSGQQFGLASRQFVRLWSPAGESVLYRVEPPLAPNADGSHVGAASGGISDDPHVVVAVFHRAAAAAEDVHPAVLRLTKGKKKVATFEHLDAHGNLGHARRDRLPMSSTVRLNAHLRRTPRLGAIAWLDDMPYVVARGTEEGTPAYAVYSRYDAPYGDLEPLIDLGEDCVARVTSSFAYLLVTYVRREGAPSAVFSTPHPTRPGRAVELPAGATLLDHEDGAFWYFEPHGSGGHFVLADPVNP
jgi:hypothetical protein